MNNMQAIMAKHARMTSEDLSILARQQSHGSGRIHEIVSMFEGDANDGWIMQRRTIEKLAPVHLERLANKNVRAFW